MKKLLLFFRFFVSGSISIPNNSIRNVILSDVPHSPDNIIIMWRSRCAYFTYFICVTNFAQDIFKFRVVLVHKFIISACSKLTNAINKTAAL